MARYTRRRLSQNAKRTFELVNKTRKALKMKPLKHFRNGIPSDATDCVIARSIGARKNNANIAQHMYFIGPDAESKARTVAAAIGQKVVPPGVNSPADGVPASGIDWAVTLPKYAHQFIEDFDQGCYPELVPVRWREEYAQIRRDWHDGRR